MAETESARVPRTLHLAKDAGEPLDGPACRDARPLVRSALLHRGDVVMIADGRRHASQGAIGARQVTRGLHLVLARAGSFVVHRGARRHLVTPGHVLLLHAGEEYRVSHPDSRGDETTILEFAPAGSRGLREVLAPLGGEGDAAPPPACVPATPEVLLRCHRLRQWLQLGVVESAEADEEALAILQGAEQARRAACEPRPRTMRRETVRAHRALADRVRLLLASSPASPHALAGLAREVGTSPYHLSRVFRAAVGLPVHRYLLRLRLALALERMANPRIPLSRVAMDLGFATHSHLTVRFQRVFGLTPADYRRTLRSGRIEEPRRRIAV